MCIALHSTGEGARIEIYWVIIPKAVVVHNPAPSMELGTHNFWPQRRMSIWKVPRIMASPLHWVLECSKEKSCWYQLRGICCDWWKCPMAGHHNGGDRRIGWTMAPDTQSRDLWIVRILNNRKFWTMKILKILHSKQWIGWPLTMLPDAASVTYELSESARTQDKILNEQQEVLETIFYSNLFCWKRDRLL